MHLIVVLLFGWGAYGIRVSAIGSRQHPEGTPPSRSNTVADLAPGSSGADSHTTIHLSTVGGDLYWSKHTLLGASSKQIARIWHWFLSGEIKYGYF
jgi:hypothetical protein